MQYSRATWPHTAHKLWALAGYALQQAGMAEEERSMSGIVVMMGT